MRKTIRVNPMELITDHYQALRQRLAQSSDKREREFLRKRLRNILGVRRFLRSHLPGFSDRTETV